MIQKVLKVGTSAAVTIPKKSLKQLGIKIGDEVTVDVREKDKQVVIEVIHTATPRQNKIAQLTGNFIKRYRKDLEALADK